MSRRVLLCLIPVALLGLVFVLPAEAAKEVTDPAEAKTDADFAVQGEYVGEHEGKKVGVQVIALGGGKFDAVLYVGGLPGDGWNRGDDRFKGTGQREGNVTTLKDENGRVVAKIEGDNLVGLDGEGKEVSKLKRTERKSPTLGAKPPAGAVVLFDGTSADKWEPAGHLTSDKSLLSGVTSKDKFGDYSLHLEFRLSWMPEARGQGRSNSGVYIHDCYEIQVLDSFGLEGENNECGGFYSIRKPDVNMCLPPLTWQTYDIDFTAPKYDGGKKAANAKITVKHNGVVIHKDLELPRDTPGQEGEGPAPRAIHLQGHGNKIYYRNVWLVEKK
jgi:hypothetical protein